ncbi:MAG: Fibronectin type domain protein, partial [Acidobacteria bacterium]|nr:Fibronectin type domain protein [Acidobacteriota bacterium]
TGYGSSTTLDTGMVTSHLQTLSGLSASTLYHYRVKSKDATGNPATSADYTFTTNPADTTPPVISSVAATNITSTGAVVSWETDQPADSKLEYGKTVAYTNSASLRSLTTSHSLKLRKLTPNTEYHFRVLSANGNGSQGISGDLTFTTHPLGRTKKTLVMPKDLRGQPGGLLAISNGYASASTSTYEFLGFALVNMDSEPATLTFTAMDRNGEVITGSDIVNPVSDELDPGQQMGVLDFEVFGDGLSDSAFTGYIMVESTSERITGLYTIFDSDLDSNLTMLDGTNLGTQPMTTFVFPEIANGSFTKVNVSNNSNPDSVDVTFELVSADGNVRSSVQKTIPGNGAIVADLYTQIFRGETPDPADYVRVIASEEVEAFELFRKGTGDIAALGGQDANGGAPILYSPQFVVGSIYQSSLSIINLDPQSGLATLRFIGEDGTQMGTTKVVTLPPNGKLYIDDPEYFQLMDLDSLTVGYVEIKSFGLRLAGSVVFGDRNGQTFSAALPLISRLQQSLLFSHVASNDIYFTGYAIVNPNEMAATAKFELFAADGSLIGTKYVDIPAWHRETGLLTEYFPHVSNMDIRSGYVRITVNESVAAYSIYGTSNLSVISAIPTQEIP